MNVYGSWEEDIDGEFVFILFFLGGESWYLGA